LVNIRYETPTQAAVTGITQVIINFRYFERDVILRRYSKVKVKIFEITISIGCETPRSGLSCRHIDPLV
jgi:hypothetical protein